MTCGGGGLRTLTALEEEYEAEKAAAAAPAAPPRDAWFWSQRVEELYQTYLATATTALPLERSGACTPGCSCITRSTRCGDAVKAEEHVSEPIACAPPPDSVISNHWSGSSFVPNDMPYPSKLGCGLIPKSAEEAQWPLDYPRAPLPDRRTEPVEEPLSKDELLKRIKGCQSVMAYSQVEADRCFAIARKEETHGLPTSAAYVQQSAESYMRTVEEMKGRIAMYQAQLQ
jgi:hypothetical protein